MKSPPRDADSPVPYGADQTNPAKKARPGKSTPGKNTPGPAEIISFEQVIDPLTFLSDLIARYGDVTRYQTKMGTCILFVHPEHVETILHSENYRRTSLVKIVLGDGLLASDGPRWRSQRRLMQKDFLPDAVAPFVEIVACQTAQMADAWQAAAAAGQTVDITQAMTVLTLRIVMKALFSEDLTDQHLLALCNSVTQTITDLGRLSWTIFGAPVQFTPERDAAFAASKQVADTMSYDMIARRRAQKPNDRPRDLLTLLIESETEAGPLTDLQVRDELLTMMVGGHETTALSLAWAWKALAENPQMEAQLHREVDDVLAGRAPQLADIARLPYARAVFQEALRLYPPVWYMARVAGKQEVIDGHNIPRGACVLISAWFTHRHKDFWPDPEKFDPSRFINPPSPPRHRYAWFPFGGGRHQCLGMHFAMLEGPLILAQLAQRCRVQPLAGQQIKPDPGLTLRQTPLMQGKIIDRSTRSAKSRESEAV